MSNLIIGITELEYVDPQYACPTCGERRLDWLVWIEGDTVRCQTCKTEYITQEAAPC